MDRLETIDGGFVEYADTMHRRPALTTAQKREIARKYREREAAGRITKPLSLYMARILHEALLTR
jgi:hypothetical protein